MCDCIFSTNCFLVMFWSDNPKLNISGFKKFTWWIKEIVEKHGGHLIDTPTKYTRCLKCFSLAIVLWSGKNNNYFIGCTKFYKGCKWAKSIWSLE